MSTTELFHYWSVKKADDKTIELSFEKPTGFQNKKGQYGILNLINPKVTELDVPYRWLDVVFYAEENNLRFHIELDDSNFSKSCELINIGDQGLIMLINKVLNQF